MTQHPRATSSTFATGRVFLLLMALPFLPSICAAQSANDGFDTNANDPVQSGGGPYRIDSSVIAAGGGTLSGGAFQLSGTFGQDATTTLSASGYHLYDGFWAPVAGNPSSDFVFINGFDP